MDSWIKGECHCRAVQFEVRVSSDEALRCNCSMCRKKGYLHLIVQKEDFRLLLGEANLVSYRFNTKVAEHRFCKTCGIHPFYTPRSHPDGVDVNLNCLPDEVASRFRVEEFDGKEWEQNVEQIR